VIRSLAAAALAVAAIVLAAPAAAQRDEMPTELWSEYPLVQHVERSSAPTIGPFLPPAPDSESVPASSDTPSWGLWLAVAGLGFIALLVAARVFRPALASAVAEPAPLARDRHVYTPGPLGQYAPTRSAVPEDGLVDEPPRSIVLRTGLVRSRYVVVADKWAEGLETVGGSRSFWSVGGARLRERRSEEAWDELVNDLRVQGWEPNPLRRSDYYVLLQRTEPRSSSTVRTLEP
jgi:hypothetical protein